MSSRIRVLGLALYGSQAASHRIRLSQFVEGLSAEDIDLSIQSLLGNTYLKARFGGAMVPVYAVISSYLERITRLFRSNEYDLVILHCELFPFVPWFLEKRLLRAPFIYDFDDAFYLRYRSGRFSFLEKFLGGKFECVLGNAGAVTAGSDYLANYALKYNGSAYFLPSCVDTESYRPLPVAKSSSFTVGWVGSPSTEGYLRLLATPLALLGISRRIRLVVMGGKAPFIDGIEVIQLPWDESSEISCINSFDVGVMPLIDDEWSRGKCAFKLVQYMACGIPVVASRVGANMELVNDSCGILVNSELEWVQALTRLAEDADLRRRMGRSARDRIQEGYSLAVNLPRLINIIRNVASN